MIRLPNTLSLEQLRDVIIALCEARFDFHKKSEKEEGGFASMSEQDRAIYTSMEFEITAVRQMLRAIEFYEPPPAVDAKVQRVTTTRDTGE